MSNRFTCSPRGPRYKDTSVILLHAGRKFGKPLAARKTPSGGFLINTQIDVIKQVFGESADIIVVLGYQADIVLNVLTHRVRTVENERFDETCSARSVLLGLRAALAGNAYIIYGDVVFDATQFTPQKDSHSHVLICPDNKERTVSVMTEGDTIRSFSYGQTEGMSWNEMLYLAGPDVEKFKKIYNANLLMYEILNRLIETGSVINYIQVKKYE